MTERKKADYYMALPYTLLLRKDEEGDIVARITEFEGCTAHGSTEAEALDALREVEQAWIEMRLEAGLPIPEPESEEDLPSGKWIQRVPKSLHRKLIAAAKKENVSMNQYCASLLAEGVGRKETVGWVSSGLESYLKLIADQHGRSIFAAYRVIYKNAEVEGLDFSGGQMHLTSVVKRTAHMMSAYSNEIKYPHDPKEISARTH